MGKVGGVALSGKGIAWVAALGLVCSPPRAPAAYPPILIGQYLLQSSENEGAKAHQEVVPSISSAAMLVTAR